MNPTKTKIKLKHHAQKSRELQTKQNNNDKMLSMSNVKSRILEQK